MGHGRFSQVSQILPMTSIDEACLTDAGLAGLRLQTSGTFFLSQRIDSRLANIFSMLCLGRGYLLVEFCSRPTAGVRCGGM